MHKNPRFILWVAVSLLALASCGQGSASSKAASSASSGTSAEGSASSSPDVASSSSGVPSTSEGVSSSTSIPRFTITFQNWDKSVLQMSDWNQGETPSYTGATPTRAGVSGVTYAFTGWSPEIVPVVSAATYTAQFSSSGNPALSDSISFGKYPQTVVEDAATLAALESATDTDGDGYIECGDGEYKQAKALTSGVASLSGNVTFVYDSTYYFKVEPIVWRVLSGKGATSGLVVSEMILSSCNFYTDTTDRTVSGTTIHANNYQYSTLRAMFNGYDGSSYGVENFAGKGFIDRAFDAAEKSLIATTAVDNSRASTGDYSNTNVCADTNDKIFALSSQDMESNSGGSSLSSDDSFRGVLSDFARITCLMMNTEAGSYGYGSWWLRSPDAAYSYYARYLPYYDSSPTSTEANDGTVGFRPALTLTLV
jgi:hypothetical protein